MCSVYICVCVSVSILEVPYLVFKYPLYIRKLRGGLCYGKYHLSFEPGFVSAFNLLLFFV